MQSIRAQALEVLSPYLSTLQREVRPRRRSQSRQGWEMPPGGSFSEMPSQGSLVKGRLSSSGHPLTLLVRKSSRLSVGVASLTAEGGCFLDWDRCSDFFRISPLPFSSGPCGHQQQSHAHV